MTSRITSNTSISATPWADFAAAPRSDLTQPMAQSMAQLLAQSLAQCRVLTLQLFESIEPETFCRQAHSDFSPIGWHLGHIGYTEAIWVLGHLAGESQLSLDTLSRPWPEYCQLFAADSLPKEKRGNLPSLGELKADLATIRALVLNYLVHSDPLPQERLWRFLLQHESQHCETIALVLAIQQRLADRWTATPNPTVGCGSAPPAPPETSTTLLARHSLKLIGVTHADPVYFPAARVTLGSNLPETLDNERPAHGVDLPAYWLDRFPVTQAQYREFITAGGYQQAQWWSAAGWDWVQASGVTAPFYGGGPETEHHPVCGVSWYEADAYARFVGQRLPTEAEWEQAAQGDDRLASRYPWGDLWPTSQHCNHADGGASGTTPVAAFPLGNSGAADLLGNVWEWTNSVFEGYPGFAPYPYTGYSQAYYDGAHYVLRGGSWATRAWALRASFRNWYYPWTREIFAGFRCARNG